MVLIIFVSVWAVITSINAITILTFPHVFHFQYIKVPISSQLIPYQEKTGPNGGQKWRQIWMFLKLLKKIAFYANQFIFLQKFIGRYIESNKKIKILTI